MAAAAPQRGLGSPLGVSCPPPRVPPPPIFSLLTLSPQEEPQLPNLLPWQLCFASLRDGGDGGAPIWSLLWGGSTVTPVGLQLGGQQ